MLKSTVNGVHRKNPVYLLIQWDLHVKHLDFRPFQDFWRLQVKVRRTDRRSSPAAAYR